MKTLRTMAWLALCGAILFPAFAGAAYEGRIAATVVDAKQTPIAGVKASVTSKEFKYLKEYTSDSSGKFTITVLDATRHYQIKLEKEGFVPYEADLPLELGATKRMTYELAAAVQAPPPPSPEQEAARKALQGKNDAILTFNEGVAALQANDLDTAAAKFEAATAKDAALWNAYAALAAVRYEQKKYAEAADAAEKTLALHADDARTQLLRYDAYKAAGNKEKAATALEAALVSNHNREGAVRLFNEAAEASRTGQGDAALALLTRTLDIDPTLTPARQAIATIYLSRKDFKSALAAVESVLAVEPANIESLTTRYEILKAMGEKAKAKEAEAAMKAARSAQGPEALFNQGVTQFNANSIQDAKATFERVLELDPNHPRAHYLLGLVYANLGESAKAKEMLQKFLELAPNDRDAANAKAMLETM